MSFFCVVVTLGAASVHGEPHAVVLCPDSTSIGLCRSTPLYSWTMSVASPAALEVNPTIEVPFVVMARIHTALVTVLVGSVMVRTSFQLPSVGPEIVTAPRQLTHAIWRPLKLVLALMLMDVAAIAVAVWLVRVTYAAI